MVCEQDVENFENALGISYQGGENMCPPIRVFGDIVLGAFFLSELLIGKYMAQSCCLKCASMRTIGQGRHLRQDSVVILWVRADLKVAHKPAIERWQLQIENQLSYVRRHEND